jgi:hypothetical protein
MHNCATVSDTVIPLSRMQVMTTMISITGHMLSMVGFQATFPLTSLRTELAVQAFLLVEQPMHRN